MTESPRIHWLGAGLSSLPGIVSLADTRGNVTVWNRTPEKAEALRRHLAPGVTLDVEKLDFDRLGGAVSAGDVVISMLPGDFHVKVAELALANDANMVTTSYLTPEMKALDGEARSKGLAIVNECGVDPGIDHLFAHILVDAARGAGVLDDGRTIDFVSYCGGFAAIVNDFRYKFSWAPLGVLTALRNKARSIRDGAEHQTVKAWEEVADIEVLGETFEVFPNRDSIPYVSEYGLAGVGTLRTFVRGTLRQAGWKRAWADIFETIETADMETLRALGAKLWEQHSYAPDEQDRVILHVALTSEGAGGDAWAASLSLDEKGSGWRTAMARTVSLTCACAVGAVLDGRMAAGVQAATHDVAEIKRWLSQLGEAGIVILAENVSVD